MISSFIDFIHINACVAYGGWVPRNLEAGAADPKPGSKSTPQACPTRNPAMSLARHAQAQPKHLSHRARSSVKIIITVITNKSNNNKDNKKVIVIKGERRVGENTKTLQELIKTPIH